MKPLGRRCIPIICNHMKRHFLNQKKECTAFGQKKWSFMKSVVSEVLIAHVHGFGSFRCEHLSPIKLHGFSSLPIIYGGHGSQMPRNFLGASIPINTNMFGEILLHSLKQLIPKNSLNYQKMIDSLSYIKLFLKSMILMY